MNKVQVWPANERAGLRTFNQYTERLITVPLNPENEEDGYFDLYYYIHRATGISPGLKTVLFCSGGPGEIVRPGDDNFLDFLVDKNTAYQVVHFHLRGSGFSQIPASNKFDRFLRTSYAVEDIERIRVAVLGDNHWDGIVGYSYGAVLAHRYVATKEYGKNVRKLILIGPMSMHKFKQRSTVREAFDDYVKAVQQIRHEILERIIAENDDLKTVLASNVKEIATQLDSIYDEIESTFGSEKFIADHYDALQEELKWTESKLAKLPRVFFEKLRDLRNFGWNPIDIDGVRSRQVEAVKVIVVSLKPELQRQLGAIEPSRNFPYDPDYGAYRALYVFRINDGLDRKYLKESSLKDETQNIQDILRRSSGTAEINQYYKKIGRLNHLEVWDPADYKHGVDTVILKGKADPVSADGQAERYFDEALTGNKALIEFDGVGHSFDFPYIKILAPFMIGSVRIEPGTIGSGHNKLLKGNIPKLARIVESDDKSPSVRSIGRKVLDFRDVIIESKNKVAVQVINSTAKAETTKDIKLVIRHLLFTGTVTLEARTIPDGVESWVSGIFEIDKKGAKFSMEPPILEEGLEFKSGSEDLILPDALAITIKNRSSRNVVGSPKNWIYLPERRAKIEGPCQGAELYSRDCIIYAFLEMEYDTFRKKQSKILDRIKRSVSFPGKIVVR
jgi:pimeloyl-ACP methyl ester carboxylesterase